MPPHTPCNPTTTSQVLKPLDRERKAVGHLAKTQPENRDLTRVLNQAFNEKIIK